MHTIGPYQGPLRRAVLHLKESNDLDLAQALGVRLGQLVPRCQTVVGVPTSARRQRWRGYCAPQRLAQAVARLWNTPLLHDFRCLGDPAPRKALRGLAARRACQETIFEHAGPISGSVLLVDDVVTSGRTLSFARQALLRAGAHRVELACIASSLESGESRR